jgi:hypothetical protein
MRFVAFNEQAAAHGLPAQQRQALPAIAGHPGRTPRPWV